MNRFHTVLGFVLLASTFACSAGVDPSSDEDTASLDSNDHGVESGKKSDVPELAASPLHAVPRINDGARTKIGIETKPELPELPALQHPIPRENDGVAFEPPPVNSPDPAPESF